LNGMVHGPPVRFLSAVKTRSPVLGGSVTRDSGRVGQRRRNKLSRMASEDTSSVYTTVQPAANTTSLSTSKGYMAWICSGGRWVRRW
jgi:hypothetical protein